MSILAADDPRHGTIAGYVAERRIGQPRCTACLTAKRSYEKARIMRGAALKVPAVGTRRRIQALRALGHSRAEIARAAGYADGDSYEYAMHAETITAATAAKIAAAYETLSMRLGSGPKANRLRVLAARKGWAPPLAWDNIDNPDEVPKGVGYVRFGSREDTFTELVDRGIGLHEVCRALHVSREALEKWCERHGMTADYRRLLERDQTRYWRNGRASGGAA